MPGFTLKHGLELRRRTDGSIVVGLLAFCLGFSFLAQLRADSTPAAPESPEPAAPPVIHVTDGQDRLASGALSPEADAKSRANALYAEAALAPDDFPGDQQKALDQLRQVVALDPHFVDAQIRIADFLIELGKLDPAFDQLKAASAANPDSVAIESMLGNVQCLRGKNDEAFSLASDALAKDPSQSMAIQVLLEVAINRDDLVSGVRHVEDILDTAGDRVPSSAWLDLARLYVEVARAAPHPPANDTQLKTLLPIYQQAAAKPPPELTTLSLLADTYRDLDRQRDALKTLQQAVTIAPDNVDMLLRCADLESLLGQDDDALRHDEQAYSLNPGVPGLREMLGALYLDHQRYDDAALLLKQAAAEAPGDIGLEINLGIAYAGSDHPAQARACFDQVFADDSCPPEAYLKLAVFQIAHHQLDKAAATLNDAQKRFPDSARVRFYQAVQQRYAKNYDAALASLDQVRALAVDSEAGAIDPGFYLEDALILNLAGKKDGMEKALREGIAKFPDNSDLMNELAYFWADQGTHLAEALALSQRALDLDPDSGPLQDTRGWVSFQMGRPKDALPFLQRAAILTNNDPVVLQHVGDTYLKLGLRNEAIDAWRRALVKDPGNSDLTSRIDSLTKTKNAYSRSAPAP